MRIRNLTPHALNLSCADGTVLQVPPDGEVARRAVIRRDGGVLRHLAAGGLDPTAGLLQVAVEALGPVEGLPAPEAGTVLVVARLVADAVPGRTDVFAPGEAIRDSTGRIVGARGLCRVVTPTTREVCPSCYGDGWDRTDGFRGDAPRCVACGGTGEVAIFSVL